MTGADECLLIRVKAEKKSMLGRLARIRKLVDGLSMKERGREYLVLYEEKGAADPGMRSVVEES